MNKENENGKSIETIIEKLKEYELNKDINNKDKIIFLKEIYMNLLKNNSKNLILFKKLETNNNIKSKNNEKYKNDKFEYLKVKDSINKEIKEQIENNKKIKKALKEEEDTLKENKEKIDEEFEKLKKNILIEFDETKEKELVENRIKEKELMDIINNMNDKYESLKSNYVNEINVIKDKLEFSNNDNLKNFNDLNQKNQELENLVKKISLMENKIHLKKLNFNMESSKFIKYNEVLDSHIDTFNNYFNEIKKFSFNYKEKYNSLELIRNINKNINKKVISMILVIDKIKKEINLNKQKHEDLKNKMIELKNAKK